MNLDREYRAALAQEIAAENTLVTHRMTWNLTFQGFLFTGYALVLSRPVADAASADRVSIFLNVLPVAGIVVAMLAIIGVFAAYGQISYLRKCWSSYSTGCEADSPGASEAGRSILETWGPRPFSTDWGDWIGRWPPILTSAILIGAWACFLPWACILP